MTLREVSQEIAAVKEQQAVIQHTQMLILDELRLLRCGGGRTDPESLETLLAYLNASFDKRPWTSHNAFEQAEDNPLLDAAITRCLGELGTIQGLSKLLLGHLGAWGEYSLTCVRKRSNAGAVFQVKQCVTPSLPERSSL
jgi:hypothetical protein